MTPNALVLQQLSDAFPDRSRIGVAVSGGSDSLALLHLAKMWATQSNHNIEAVTVDHGLRAEAAAEADFVSRVCGDLGILHTTLTWTGWDGAGNLQNAARTARYSLIADWAKGARLDAVLLGHTEDDVAETFLMRLARKSGVGGLSAMAPEFRRHDMRFMRPLLGVSRAALRDILDSFGQAWIDDPTNEDAAFDRVKTRQVMRELTPLGLDASTIATSARALGEVKTALDYYLHAEALRRVREDRGDLILDLGGDLPAEMRRRLISAGLHWFTRQDYPPRGASMANLEAALNSARQHTAAGVLVRKMDAGKLRMSRELAAVAGLKSATDEMWDKRWIISGPHSPDLHVCALGDGVNDCPDWRDSGLARASVMAAPAIWKGDELIGVPILGVNPTWQAKIDTAFADFLLSH